MSQYLQTTEESCTKSSLVDSLSVRAPLLGIWQITIVSQSNLAWLKCKGERTAAHSFSVGLLWTQGVPMSDLPLGTSRSALRRTLSAWYLHTLSNELITVPTLSSTFLSPSGLTVIDCHSWKPGNVHMQQSCCSSKQEVWRCASHTYTRMGLLKKLTAQNIQSAVF